MEYFWVVLCSLVFLMVLWSYLSSRAQNARREHQFQEIRGSLPVVNHFHSDQRYNVFLNHGVNIRNVKFLGISQIDNDLRLPFPHGQWLVVEKSNGKRVYFRPNAMRYYEDVEEDDSVHGITEKPSPKFDEGED